MTGLKKRFISFLLVLLLAGAIPVSLWAGQDELKACCENLKRLSEALKTFKSHHEDKLPDTISELKGTYVKTLPSCPMGGTYEYTVGINKKRYTLECRGWAHRDVIGKSQPIIVSYHESLEILPEPTPSSTIDQDVKKTQFSKKVRRLLIIIKDKPYLAGAVFLLMIIIVSLWLSKKKTQKKTLEQIEDFIS